MSPSRVSAPLDFNEYHNTINGLPRKAKAVHNGVNPATKAKLWDVPIASQQDLDEAVDAAQKAFVSWRKVPLAERKNLLNRYADAIEVYHDQLADLLIKEAGKPRWLADGEPHSVCKHIRTTSKLGIPDELYEDDEKKVVTQYVPIGVVGAICPWNFPILLSMGKIAPALLTGNTIIVKPSPFTPYSTLKLVEIAQEIFPPGVVQALGGDDRLGPWMTAHPGISKISFTGSIATGKKIAEACAKSLKRVTLELGGNDACIVCPDVDIEKAAQMVAMGALKNSGQICVAIKRVFVHQSIYTEFMKAMINGVQALKVGAGDQEGVKIGPVQNGMQYEKVGEFFKDTADHGYKFAYGGKFEPSEGFFVQPALVDNPPTDSRIWKEEPFGPIVPLQPWTDEADVVERANATNTGLGATIWGKNNEQVQRLAEQMEAGTVAINSSVRPDPAIFFSGHKESGVGGEWGARGVYAYCNARAIFTYKS